MSIDTLLSMALGGLFGVFVAHAELNVWLSLAICFIGGLALGKLVSYGRRWLDG